MRVQHQKRPVTSPKSKWTRQVIDIDLHAYPRTSQNVKQVRFVRIYLRVASTFRIPCMTVLLCCSTADWASTQTRWTKEFRQRRHQPKFLVMLWCLSLLRNTLTSLSHSFWWRAVHTESSISYHYCWALGYLKQPLRRVKWQACVTDKWQFYYAGTSGDMCQVVSNRKQAVTDIESRGDWWAAIGYDLLEHRQ